jgi:beta-glucosidase
MNPTLTSLISGALVACTLTGCGGGDSTQTTVAPPTADTLADDKASARVAQMTLDEKIQLVHGNGFGNSPVGGAGWIPGIARLGIPELYTADSAAGVGVSGANVTPMPAPVALAASWDPTLAHEYGQTIAAELRTLGFYEGLGGGVNLAREPRNGRNFEYMGEDPVLAGELVAQRTIGTQSQKVVATLKHYALNNQEANRFTSNSQVDERTMRELYLLPFEIGVKQGEPGNVMCSYNLVNNLKACQNPYLLTDVLKKEWGFKGKVQSDWFLALTDTVQAATAGLDEEQAGSTDDSAGIFGFPTFFNQKLKAAVQNGSVPLSRLNDMVFRQRAHAGARRHSGVAAQGGRHDRPGGRFGLRAEGRAAVHGAAEECRRCRSHQQAAADQCQQRAQDRRHRRACRRGGAVGWRLGGRGSS